MHTLFKFALLCVSGAAALACEHNPKPANAANEQARPTDLTPPMTAASGTHSAQEQIASARCEREQTCGNIGDNKSYSSSQDCLARIRADWKDDLNARECPGGVNNHELSECLEQIRGEACGNPFDTLARVTECTQRQICIE
jgi:hypothetical protein